MLFSFISSHLSIPIPFIPFFHLCFFDEAPPAPSLATSPPIFLPLLGPVNSKPSDKPKKNKANDMPSSPPAESGKKSDHAMAIHEAKHNALPHAAARQRRVSQRKASSNSNTPTKALMVEAW